MAGGKKDVKDQWPEKTVHEVGEVEMVIEKVLASPSEFVANIIQTVGSGEINMSEARRTLHDWWREHSVDERKAWEDVQKQLQTAAKVAEALAQEFVGASLADR